MAAAPRTTVFGVDEAWQSVSLEERLELISKAQASGFLAATVNICLLGSIAYGFDKIWLLVGAIASSFFIFPLFSSYSWRNGKPSLILAYLAVRTVARRYAYGYNIPDIDIILVYRGRIKELFLTREDEELAKQRMRVDFDTVVEEYKHVWIVLMRGGVVIMSEKQGGAKLEFLAPITHETTIRDALPQDDAPANEKASVIEGSGLSKGRKILLSSRYPAAQYVFERQMGALIEEQIKSQESLEKLRKKAK